jgi:tetratricopeptide (TPR) repeat protein
MGGPRRGDVIAANVEGGAQGVAVGKNIVQIGTLAVPVWPLFALLVVFAVGTGVWALRQRGPTTMEGQFNVAVADFVALDMQGRPVSSANARQLGSIMFDMLQESYPQPSRALLIWRDGSVSWTQQGARIGTISDSTQAITVAKTIKADIVIYGTLDAQSRFTLQLYVSQRPGIYGDANAIVGAYRFGEPIQLNPADVAASSDALTKRTHALVAFVKGMRADSQGDFGAASTSYDEAERLLPAGTNSAKAIIAYFKGQSAYYKSVFDPSAPTAPQLLNEARQSFEEALRNDPDYARAQIGLGAVFFQQAKLQPTAKRLQNPELEQAINAFNRAITMAPRTSEQGWIEAAARQNLATAYYIKGGTLFRLKDDATADQWLAKAATLIAQTRPTLEASHEYRLLAQLYQTQGNVLLFRAQIAERRGDPAAAQILLSQADAAYVACVAQLEVDPARYAESLQVIVNGCASMRKQLETMAQPTKKGFK